MSSSSSSSHRAGQRRGDARVNLTKLARATCLNPNKQLTYSLNGLTMSFVSATSPRNASHNMGVVYSYEFCPARVPMLNKTCEEYFENIEKAKEVEADSFNKCEYYVIIIITSPSWSRKR